MLYEALTGRRPFLGPADGLARQIRRDAPPLPSSLRRGVPADLEAVVLRCLEKRPRDRYADAGELAADLDTAARRGGAGVERGRGRRGGSARGWRWRPWRSPCCCPWGWPRRPPTLPPGGASGS